MIDTLREIEKGHEAKYKLDEETRFKARCRRNKLFGLWAAEQMGITGAKAEDYAKSLVRLEIDRRGADFVVGTVLSDFERLGVGLTEQEVFPAFAGYLSVALEQLAEEFPTALDTDHIRVGD